MITVAVRPRRLGAWAKSTPSRKPLMFHDRRERFFVEGQIRNVLRFLHEDLRHLLGVLHDVVAAVAPRGDVGEQFGVSGRPDGDR